MLNSKVHLRSSLQSIPDESPSPFDRIVHDQGLSTSAASGGLKPPPIRRLRWAYHHLLYSIATRAFLTHLGEPLLVQGFAADAVLARDERSEEKTRNGILHAKRRRVDRVLGSAAAGTRPRQRCTRNDLHTTRMPPCHDIAHVEAIANRVGPSDQDSTHFCLAFWAIGDRTGRGMAMGNLSFAKSEFRTPRVTTRLGPVPMNKVRS
jgi:hypothetical protein